MKLYEFQGKRIFKENNIPVPKGTLIVSPNQPIEVDPPAVLKTQVLVGGRGKAGGIKIWDSSSKLSELLQDMFSQKLKGEPVRAILAEEKVDIVHEFYLSITFKGNSATHVLVASSAGGVEIEKIAQENPGKIITLPIDPFLGPTAYQVRYVAKTLGLKDHRELQKLINSLYAVYSSYDATLVEINPLALTPTGLVALDAKILLDDKSRPRQEKLFSLLVNEQQSLARGDREPEEAKPDTITYVPMSGSVGLISDGAGTGMLTLDLIKDVGEEAANFCELGSITNPEVMYNAMAAVLKNPEVKSLLIVLIGGFNRMDDMAEGILGYREDNNLKIPLVVRMCGTMEEVGKEMMDQAGIPTYDDLLGAVREVVALAKEK